MHRFLEGFAQFHEAGDETVPSCRKFGVVRKKDLIAAIHKDYDGGRDARKMGAAAGVADPGAQGFAAAPVGERSAAE